MLNTYMKKGYILPSEITDCAWLRNGVYFEAVADDNRNIRSCCRISPETSVDSIHTLNTSMKNTSEYTFENLKESACSKCSRREEINGYSMRNTEMNKIISEKAKPGQIALLQVCFSNFCNFKCRYCTPKNSTSWNDDIKTMDSNGVSLTKLDSSYREYMNTQQTYEYEKRIIAELETQDLSMLTYLGVFGGEPFMARNLEDFLIMLDNKADLSKCVLQINTNGSIFPKEKILNILSKFKRVDLRCSVEATGKLAEYIRTGLNWNSFERIIGQWRDFAKANKSIKFRIHLTNCIYNINKLPEMEQWLIEKDFKFVTEFAYDPDHIDIRKILNNEQLDECKRIVETLKLAELRDPVLNFLNDRSFQENQPEVLEEFKLFTSTIDNVRGDSLEQVNPQLYKWTHCI